MACPAVLPVVVDPEVCVEVPAVPPEVGLLTTLFAPEDAFGPPVGAVAEDDPPLAVLTVVAGAVTRVGAVAPPVPVVH